MEIVIHGTKGGRRTFTINKLSGLLDVTSDSPATTAIGREVYAIRFTAEYTIFSKYKIIRDVRGDKRTGFVGFSLFLAANEKLSGADIVILLDRVAEEYTRKYIVDNNLDDITEDWSFLEPILDGYKVTHCSHRERILSGSADDAFIYFKDKDELKQYFAVPYQEEYGKYRQILFIDQREKGTPENPLYALRHSTDDLTEKIDPENLSYKLLITSQPIQIKVLVEGKERRDREKIRKKEKLDITYTQKFRVPDSISGTWCEIQQQCPACIAIDEEKETITLLSISLVPKQKDISVKVMDKYGERISEYQIECKGKYSGCRKEISNENQFVFEGDEIGEFWDIHVSAEGYKSIEKQYKPENLGDELTIILQKEKKIILQVVDEDTKEPISHYQLKIYGETDQPHETVSSDKRTIFFYDDEITKTWNIEVKGTDYEIKKIDFYPESQNEPIEIALKKRRIRKYALKIDKQVGKTTYNGKPIGKYIDKEPNFGCDPRFGYKFEKWNGVDEPSDGYDGYYEAIFSKKWYLHIFRWIWGIGLVAVLGLLIIGGISFFMSKEDNNRASNETKSETTSVDLESKIKKYIQGDSLFLDKLKEYESSWKQQSSKIKSNIVWWNPLSWFDNGETVLCPDDFSRDIKDAINKRTWINKGDFEGLKKLSYSSEQKIFKDAIEKMDSQQYATVREQLGDVSNLTLSQIAEKIDSILIAEADPYHEIRVYLEEVDLNGNILNNYKQKVKGKDNQLEKRIDECIALRRSLNQGNVNAVQISNFPYSVAQQALKDAIDGLNDTNKQYVGNNMKKSPISTMTLDEIAIFITSQVAEFNEKQGSAQAATVPSVEPVVSHPTTQPVAAMDGTATEIIEYLKSGELRPVTLEEYKNKTENKNLIKSIDLALKFWRLDGSSNNSYSSYLAELTKDSNLKESELIVFVRSMHKPKPKYVTELPGQDRRKSLKELKDKL